MADTSSQGNAGQIGITDPGSAFNQHSFQTRQMLGRQSINKLVKIMAINPGQGSDNNAAGQAGTVDVQIITKQMDGEGNSTSHSTVYGLPYVRHQNGQHAIIMDPVVGDIGPMAIQDRDISANISMRGEADPGSNRRFNPSDGIYHGGVLNAAPTTYFQQATGNQTHYAKYIKGQGSNNGTGGDQTHTSIGGNRSVTTQYSSDNKNTNGNQAHTAQGGNIGHTAQNQSGNGGNISHTATGGNITDNSTASGGSGGTISRTADNTHTTTAPQITHNGKSTLNGRTNVTQLLSTNGLSQFTNHISS